ncbi:hypothetical protein Bca52824_091517 [Brassica carinata]|uniref:HSF-type DNA-binding domain-containing protein n=1 Tax=Brassica carinata TaxID=52824 RepID=A0A8X7NWP9_BRACI|nr:hypothetical protein Bca52824_091517 [Brassica carinata]
MYHLGGYLGFEAIVGMQKFNVDVYEVVDDPSLDPIISWSKSNKSFVIWDPKQLVEKKILLLQFATGFVRIKGSDEHLEFGHEQYFVRGKPELLTKMRLQVALDWMKKRAKEAKARAEEEEKNGAVTVRGEPRIIIHAEDARMRYNQIFEPSSTTAKTPLENRFRHLRI